MSNKSDKIGAVITFPEGTSPELVSRFLEHFTHYSDKIKIESYHMNTYDPKWGNPVWYIP